MKRYCPVETHQESYVEFSEVWSRSDIRRFSGRNGNMLDVIRDKVTEINIRLVDGVLESADDITEETLDRMQWEVFQWFIYLPQVVVREILDLGEATRRQLLLTPETSKDTEVSANA